MLTRCFITYTLGIGNGKLSGRDSMAEFKVVFSDTHCESCGKLIKSVLEEINGTNLDSFDAQSGEATISGPDNLNIEDINKALIEADLPYRAKVV